MARVGFTSFDFDVFRVAGFDERVEQIYARIRPKLLRLGEQLAPELTRRLGMGFFPHVARHNGRTAAPPETWTAFGPSPRGYKSCGYLALCISGAGLHARCIVGAEAVKRSSLDQVVAAHAAQLAHDLRGGPLASYEQWNFRRLPDGAVRDGEWFVSLADRLGERDGRLDLGFGWNRAEAVALERAELIDAFHELAPLYRLVCAG